MNRRASAILLIAFCGLLSACSKHSPSNPHNTDERKLIAGELYKEVAKNYESPAVNECDFQYKDAVLNMIKDIDSHQDVVKAEGEKLVQKNTNDYPSVDIAGVRFFDLQRKKSTEGWQTWSDSWQYYLDYYEALKRGQPDKNWRTLDEEVRYFVSDESDRLISRTHPTLDRASGPLVLSLNQKLESCAKQNCALNLLSEEREFLNRGWDTSRLLRKFEQATSSDERSKALTTLAEWFGVDAIRYGFIKNDKMRQTAPGVFEFQFDLGVLASDIATFQSAILKFWTGEYEGKQQKIVVHQSAGEEIFKLLLPKALSGRAGVARRERTLTLYPIYESRIFAHELGHVFGFKDRYFTSFDRAKCAYKNEINYDDIMSSSRMGSVTPELWKMLNEAYPVTN